MISGVAIEALEVERLVAQYVDEVRSSAKNSDPAPEVIADKLFRQLDAQEVTYRGLAVASMHVDNSETIDSNIDIWFKAETIAEARNKIQEVPIRYQVPSTCLN